VSTEPKPWQRKLSKGDCFVYLSASYNILVWGEVLTEGDVVEPDYRLCRLFSKRHPHGEEGFIHVSVVNGKVSRAALNRARRVGWPHDESSFTNFAKRHRSAQALN
jgi:hypothetical protein